MRKALLIALLFFPVSSWAAFSSKDRGTTTANFLKLGVGARAVAMGEAYSAVADDATSLYWNPAALTQVESHSATFMHAPYLASTFYDYGAYAQRFGNHAFGAGIQYFSAGSIDQTDENNTDLGSFKPYDMAAAFGYGYTFAQDGPALGFSGKYIQSKILETASAFAVDLGALSQLYADRWRFAFTATNIGSEMKFEEESESLPLALRMGSMLKITDHWVSSLDLAFPKDNDPYLALGTEYAWQATDNFTFAGRLGYNSLTTGDVSGFSGVSIGAGFGFPWFSFDYAVLPYGGLGITHRMSLSMKWGASESASSRTARPLLSKSYSDEDDLDTLLKKK